MKPITEIENKILCGDYLKMIEEIPELTKRKGGVNDRKAKRDVWFLKRTS